MDGTPSSLMIGLLTSFRLERDGEVVLQFRGRKQDELLAFVALQPKAARSRISIVDHFWPDKPMRLARNRLSEVLFLLNDAMERVGVTGVIVADRYSVGLSPDVTTDVQLFRTGIASALEHHDPLERARRLESSLLRYGSGLLPEVDWSWLRAERRRLAALYQSAAEEFARALTVAGEGGHLAGLTAELPLLEAVDTYLQGRAGTRGSLVAEARIGPPRGVGTGTAWTAVPATPGAVGDWNRTLAERAVALAEQAEPHLRGAERSAWLARLDAEQANLRLAMDWALERRELDLAFRLGGALWHYWHARGLVDEGRRTLERLLAERPQGHTIADAKVTHGAGALAIRAGDLETARERTQQALALWRQLDVPTGIGRALVNLGIISYRQKDYARARKAYDEAQAIGRLTGEPSVLARALGNAAMLALSEEDFDRAEVLLREELLIGENAGNDAIIAKAHSTLGTLAQNRGLFDEAREHAERALALCQAMGDLGCVGFCLRSLGFTARKQGHLGDSKTYYEESLRIARSMTDLRNAGESLRYLADIHEEMGDLDAAATSLSQSLGLLEQAGDAPGVVEVKQQQRELAQRRGGG